MTNFSTIKRFLADERGATAIEYGLIGALVSVFAMGALGAMGDGVAEVFDIASTSVEGAIPASE